MKYKYVFGPVLSGRLGRSLGLDLTAATICSMDCLYCEVGRTAVLTTERKAYVPAKAILDELAHWHEHVGLPLDAVTLGGSGEPLLNTEFSEVIRGARRIMPSVPVAVLTNASLLVEPEVRRELTQADIVLPSLDSLVDEEFAAVNRPAQGVTPQAVAEALLAFRNEFAGRIFLEVLLVAGVNDSEENLRRLKAFVPRLRPDRVDVVTMTRPGAYTEARAVPRESLERWRRELRADITEAVGQSSSALSANLLTKQEIQEIVQNSVRRRPQTVAQLAQATGLSAESVREALDILSRTGGVRVVAAPAGESGNEQAGALDGPYYSAGRR